MSNLLKHIKELVYFLYDLITWKTGYKRTINNLQLKFPVRYARYYENDYEKDAFSFYNKKIKEGDVVFDIGAHIGLFTVLFSKLVGNKGQVYVFEPTKETFKILEQTVQLNEINNCKLINAAVTKESGDVFFNLTSKSGEGSNANTLVKTERGVKTVKVNAWSIDDFRRKYNLKVNVLKIDVEGAELDALIGAKETFLNDKPIGVLALHPSSIVANAQSLEEIWKLLKTYGCNIYYKGSDINEVTFCEKKELFDVEFECK
jgi:FkbM family methyltransferase